MNKNLIVIHGLPDPDAVYRKIEEAVGEAEGYSCSDYDGVHICDTSGEAVLEHLESFEPGDDIPYVQVAAFSRREIDFGAIADDLVDRVNSYWNENYTDDNGEPTLSSIVDAALRKGFIKVVSEVLAQDDVQTYELSGDWCALSSEEVVSLLLSTMDDDQQEDLQIILRSLRGD